MCLLNLVHTSIYRYLLVCNITTPDFIQIRLDPPCDAVSSLLLAIVCSIVRPPKRGLPRPNCHSHRFTSYTSLSRLPSTAAESAQPNGKPESLRLLNMWGMVGVEFPARKQGIRVTLPTIFWAGLGATYTGRQGVGDGSYSLISPASSMSPLMGNSSSSKVLKKTRVWRRSSGPDL